MIDKKALSINCAALLQGIVLVVFPAISTILTDPEKYHLSNTDYGTLFIPQAILSITAASINPKVTRQFGSKAIFLSGLLANFLSMCFLVLSSFFMSHSVLSYTFLLLATASLGVGFGLTVPTLNSLSCLLNPFRVDASLLILNFLLGIGTALAPILIVFFSSFAAWWLLPLFLSIALISAIAFSNSLDFPGGKIDLHSTLNHFSIPHTFWLYAFFAFLYGIMETLNGNWLSIYMKEQMNASLKLQSIALMTFWCMVSVGRLFFALSQKLITDKNVFRTASFVIALAFLWISLIDIENTDIAIFIFGLSGFGCSALLPLIMGIGRDHLTTMTSSIPGFMISFYLLGYGLAAFTVGPIEETTGITLRGIYGIGAMVSILAGILSIYIVDSPRENKSLNP